MKTGFIVQAAVGITLLGFTGGCSSYSRHQGVAALQKGKSLLSAGSTQKALVEFGKAAKDLPDDPEAHYYFGMALVKAGEVSDAQSEFYRVVQLNSGYADARFQLARIMVNKPELQEVIWGGQFATVELKQSPHGPHAAETHFLVAISLWRQGQKDEASKELEKALSMQPSLVKAAASLALLRLTEGDIRGAEAPLLSVPEGGSRYQALGEFYRLQGRLADAEHAFRLARQQGRNDAATAFNLAEVLFAEDRPSECGTLLIEAGKRDQSLAFFYSLFLIQQGQWDRAITQLRQIAAQDPSDRKSRGRLVAALIEEQDFDAALNLLNEALSRNSNDVSALAGRANVYTRQNRFDDAELDLAAGTTSGPSSEIHLSSALLKSVQGNLAQARRQLVEATDDSDLLAARIQYSRLLVAQNDPLGALSIMRATPFEQRMRPSVIAQRNWALLSSGDIQQARQVLSLAPPENAELRLQLGFMKPDLLKSPQPDTEHLRSPEESYYWSKASLFNKAEANAGSDAVLAALRPQPFRELSFRPDLLEYPQGPLFKTINLRQLTWGVRPSETPWPFFAP